MAANQEVLTQIAMLCRTNHHATLFAVGWLTAGLPQEDLDALLALLQGLDGVQTGANHYEAYRERWGRIPDHP